MMASVEGSRVRIGREHHADDLRLVMNPSGNSGRIGPVDQAAGENFLLRQAAFALDEAAGKLAGGVSVLAVIHRQRKKCRSGLGSSAAARGHQDHRSPERTTTAPLACLAILPVSRVILRPPKIYFKSVNHCNFLQLQRGIGPAEF